MSNFLCKNRVIDKYNILFEKTLSMIPKEVIKNIQLKEVKKSMDSKSFLLEDKKVFPIKRPNNENYDPHLLYASYIKLCIENIINPSKKLEYAKSKAAKIILENKIKINLNIDEKFAENDPRLLKAIYLAENEEEKLNDIDDEIKDKVDKVDDVDDISEDIETCICPKCGYEEELSIEDDGLCEDKTCPVCGAKMANKMDIENENEFKIKLKNTDNLKDKMKIVVENDLKTFANKKSDRYICESCKLVINEYVNKKNNNLCPLCGESTHPITENEIFTLFENTIYNHCPKCSTMKTYSLKESECPVCSSLMVAYNTKVIKNKGIK